MQDFDYAAPSTLNEAISILSSNGESARMLAGGTDILIQLRVKRRQAAIVVDGKNIPELNEFSQNGNGLVLGAAVTCRTLWENQDIATHYPAIHDSASIIGGIQVQGRATFGGNLCNAAPSADAIPTLIVLGATATVASQGGTKEIPVEEFCTGPGQTVLKPNELLVNIRVPAPEPNSGAHYQRFTPRNEMDIAVAGVGASVVLDSDKKTVKAARVALSAVGPTPIFAKEVGDYLVGKSIDDESVLERAGELAKEAARPITDMRGTADQRRRLCAVLTKRALRKASERARG